jgi:hypothetical protein
VIGVLRYGGRTSLRFHFVSDCNIPGTLIGPLWLEGEMQSRESPVPVLTGTTAGPQE